MDEAAARSPALGFHILEPPVEAGGSVGGMVSPLLQVGCVVGLYADTIP